ncbi:F-box domain-containing protein [Mycena chlorophos]|uniref:F-box domain-containing protein n=1 Tax=Mycena chlorophos TaxID=658473 RepID=A0A8H6S7A7_MYCCL|nr:F-box domain-containing protein [Mycena chlorophos]
MLNSLPVELVVEIFLRCIPPSPSVFEVDRIDLCAPRYAPLLLTQICSSWRNIALSAPVLWSRFNVACNLVNRRRQVAQLADLWLSRSGDCLLEVHLAGAMFEVASAESFVATLAQHATHIGVLTLWVDNVALGRIDELRMTFPAIQELRLFNKRNRTHTLTAPGIEEVWSASVAQSLASASTLCRLVLWGVPLSCLDLPCTHITSFCATQEDFNQVAHALQNLPNLISLEAHLHLREADPQSESLPCIHEKLRSLSLKETRGGWLAEFQSPSALTRLTLPSLEELHWSCPDEDSSALDPFLDRSSVCLRKLHLSPMAIWVAGFDLPGTAVFKKPSLAGLQELGISSPKADDFDRFCNVLGSDPTFLHELRRLIVSFPASRFRQRQNGTQDAPDPHAAIQHLAPAIRSRMALAQGKPWMLRSLNINWGHSWDRQGAVSFFESAPELVEPFRALRTQGVDVYVGGTWRRAASLI